MRAAVLAVLAASPGMGADALAGRLAALGTDAMPTLLALLDESQPPHQPARRIAPLERSAVLQAFRRLPRLEVQIFLRRIAAQAGESRRTQALHVLGEVATPRDLDLFMALVDSGEEPSDEELGEALRTELGRLLRARPESTWAVAARLFEFPPSFYVPVLHAVVGAGSDDLPRLLAGLLGRDARLDPFLLLELQRAARTRCDALDPQVLASVHPFLDSEDRELLVQAVLTVAELGDAEIVPRLIALLEHADAPVREAAGRALHRLTGKPYGRDARVWERWWLSESRWWRIEGQHCMKRLSRDDPASVAQALRLLSEKAVFRHEIGDAIRPCLKRKDTDLVCLACSVLAELRACSAVPDLLLCLEHPQERVRSAARDALVRIAGKVPPGPPGDPGIAPDAEPGGNEIRARLR